MESIPEKQASVALWQYCPPVLFAFGTFGNTMTVVIIRRMKMMRSAMPVYLTALAISDTCQILTGLLRGWLTHVVQVDVRTLHTAACKVHTWLVYSSIITSAWLLSFMTIERTVSVWRPHRVSLLCTRSKAVVVIVVIVLTSLIVNCHLLVWLDVVVSHNGTTKECTMTSLHYRHFFENVWVWVDLTLSSLLPFTLVLLGNLLIVWKVSLSVRTARDLGSSRPQDISHRQKKTSSMTVTLMVLSVVFLITTSPICVYNIIEPYLMDDLQGDVQGIARLSLAWAVVNMLMYTNSTVNFYLYCLSGARFRRELKRCLCCHLEPSLTPSKNPDVGTGTNHSQPHVDTPVDQYPISISQIPLPGISHLPQGQIHKQFSRSSSSGSGRKKESEKKVLNHCTLLSLQTCDQTYVSCSDF